jgi:hypothetical protein
MEDGVMTQLFTRFLEQPTRENYVAVFDVVTNSPDYNPYANDLERLSKLVEQGKFEVAIERAYELMPVWVLSPRIHILVSIAHARTGNEKVAEMERAIAFRCLEGIENTGDGSEARPYLVASTADEYDVLAARGKKLGQQSLHERGDKHLDCMACESGEEIWFDITKAYDQLTNRRGGRRSAGDGP